MNHRGAVVLLAALAACGTVAAQATGDKPPPCRTPEHRQFDFWIGRWAVFTPDGKKAGENVIEPIEGGCALIERWQGGRGFSGTSLNGWDAAARQWRQHWVDNQGGLLRLAGTFDGRRMVLSSTEPDAQQPGAVLHQRITWTPQTNGEVHQLWEQSKDGGATWSVAFDGRYVKLK